MTGKRVLYIDDDAGIRRLVGRAMERRGYHMTLAESGADGIAMARAEPYDLIAVDHYMPGMDGLETLNVLRVLPDAPPVVYVTGSDEGRIAVAAGDRALQLGPSQAHQVGPFQGLHVLGCVPHCGHRCRGRRSSVH